MKSVNIVHLDLGIGGAENLIVNCAVGLKSKGHNVKIFTSHHDKRRCFQPTSDGSVEVVVYGHWIPRQIFGRFIILMSTVRMFYIAMCMFLFNGSADVVITDQVRVCLLFVHARR